MRRLRIWHETRCDFSAPVQLMPHQLMLRPREGHALRIESSRMDISPPSAVKWHRDAYDNSVATVSFSGWCESLSVSSTVIVQHFDESPLDFIVADDAVHYPFVYSIDDAAVLAPYRGAATAQDGDALRGWIARYRPAGDRVQTYVLLEALCRAIAHGFTYQAREEPGVQAPSLTLAFGRGSCRDFASLFMEAVRALGLAARFVSGYLHAPGLVTDSGSTHAWAEVYLPGAGWKGFDPTIGTVAGSDHISVAVARVPEAVPPIAGAFVAPAAVSSRLRVRVDVSLTLFEQFH